LPISPLCCVFLTPNKYKDYFTENECLKIGIVKEDELVMDFNKRALFSENTYSKSFVVGDDTNELKRLRIILQQLNEQS